MNFVLELVRLLPGRMASTLTGGVPMTLYLLFLALQLLDLATTLLFLHYGVAEANPLLGNLLRFPEHRALGLFLAKAVGGGLGLYIWRSGRLRLLRRANAFFALCVAWNVAAILVARARP